MQEKLTNKNYKLKYLNLFYLAKQMSITAKISILHRISGVILFFSIPFFIYILIESKYNDNFYHFLYSLMQSDVSKIFLIIFLGGLIYHSISGIRFLLLDIDRGVNKKTAKISAYMVLYFSIIITLILGYFIW